MRSIFTIALLVTLIGSGSYFYYAFAAVCRVPFTYRLGTFDERFNLSETEAKALLGQAESVWEKAAGQELFSYDEQSDFPVNFIFDDRQERTIAEEAQRTSLDQKEETSAEVGAQYAKLKDEYTKLEAEYDDSVAAYDARLDEFNKTVASYNDQGGAPEKVYANLKKTESKLATEAAALQKKSNQLATLAKDINSISERGNRLIEQYNAGVSEYNHSFGASNEFTQGDYQGTSINIYKFSNETELVDVLAHEFGHALGLGHVEGTSSIMYYLLEGQPKEPVLSSEDTAAFVSACGTGSSVGIKFYRFINSVINSLL